MWVRVRARQQSGMGIHIVVVLHLGLGLGFGIVPSPLVLPELWGCQQAMYSMGVERLSA